MRHIIHILLLSLALISFNASAILITDTYIVEKQLSYRVWEGHFFELIPAGYSPATDSITHIKLIYDFTEIWSPQNQGDTYQYDDGSYPEFPGEDAPQYEDEPATFSSWIFYWRDWYGDIDTGLTVFEQDWIRSDSYCQFENIDEETEVTTCALNIDLNGTMNAHILPETNNLWLHSIKVEVEVDRVEVPEPNPLLLLGLGLFAIGFLRSRKLKA